MKYINRNDKTYMKKNGMIRTGSGKQEESQRSNPNIGHSWILQICFCEFCDAL